MNLSLTIIASPKDLAPNFLRNSLKSNVKTIKSITRSLALSIFIIKPYHELHIIETFTYSSIWFIY